MRDEIEFYYTALLTYSLFFPAPISLMADVKEFGIRGFTICFRSSQTGRRKYRE